MINYELMISFQQKPSLAKKV